jgi:cytoskeleton protein RodZ
VFEIGPTLREARVRRKLTLQQAEDDTKIRVKYLQAMENEDFEVMPGITYVKGFLRTYATYLGLDGDIIIDEFTSRAGPEPEHEPFGGVSALGKPYSHRRRNTLAFVAFACVLVIIVLIVVGNKQGGTNTPPKTNPDAIGLSSSPSASPKTTPSSAATTTVASSLNRAVLRVSGGSCWVSITEGSTTGKLLFSGTLKNGSHASYSSHKAIFVVVGVPTTMTIEVVGGQKKKLSGAGPLTYRVYKGKVVKL